MDFGIKGKAAIVTGASRGIGRACAVALAGEGVRVCAAARNQDLLDETVKNINTAGGEGISVSAELTSDDACKRLVDSCVERFGGVDILINAAGAARGGDILDLDIGLIDEAMALKAHGYLRLSQLVIPHMQKNKWGRIVNIGGRAGASPERGNIPTAIANSAISNVVRALSDAVAVDGIMVNIINPGMTNTQRVRDINQARAVKEGKNVEDLIAELGSKLPAGRVAEPEEIAKMACFLASSACSYVFGSSIFMDGGHRRATP